MQSPYHRLSIYLHRENSVDYFHEQLLHTHANVTLQYYTNDQKHKLTELSLQIKTHRAILSHHANADQYFEVLYSSIKPPIECVKRGMFQRMVYKLKFCYSDKVIYELKDQARGNFEQQCKDFVKACEDSKGIVS